jgi:APA family basic amino acid/polyamine antiporter
LLQKTQVQQLRYHLLAAVGCAFAGLCYAEFASMIPVAGVLTSYHIQWANLLIIGWDLVLEYALGAATVAVSWSQYVDKFLQITEYTFHNPYRMVLGTQNQELLIYLQF